MKDLTCIFSGISSLVLLASVADVSAAAITPGDLIIYRVGDGAAALGTTAASVFLDEYTPAGVFVQSIPAGFTAVGNATTEGIISRSQDGSALIFTGYNKAAGGTSPASDPYTTTARLIASLGFAGTISTYSLTSINGSTTANTIRSATSVDGSSAFWVSTSANVSYVGAPSPGGSGATLIDARNSRQVNLSGNTLFAANGSTAITSKVQQYGTLPTGATSPTPVVSLATGDAVNGFALFDLNPMVPGDDTLYALSTVENLLRKYTFDGSSWVASGSIGAGNALNLAGSANGGTVTLFLTTGSSLLTETDTSGYNANITGSLSTLASAGGNTAFRGIGLLAVPEPGTAALGLLSLSLALLRKIRR